MDARRESLRLGFICSVLLVGLLAASPSWAELSCGNVIGPGAVAFLTQDLTCPSDNPALTLQGGSILILGWHTVACNTNPDNSGVGIKVTGGGSILQLGTVKNCLDAVVVAGTGGHLITKVTATNNFRFGFESLSAENEFSYNTSNNNGDGFRISANRNTVKRNLAKNNLRTGFNVISSANMVTKNRSISNQFARGFTVFGNQNKLIGNLAKDNGNGLADDGFEISGSNNELISNRSIGNFGAGFRLFPGSGNTVVGNWARKNQQHGIRLTDGAINSRVIGNVAVRNDDDDLEDENFAPPCDNNTWLGNFFRTRNQTCIH